MRSCKRMVVTGLAVLFVLASLWVPSSTDAGRLFRLSVEFGAFASGEISATSGVPGDEFYSKTVTVPVIGDDTATFLYVTLSGSVEVFNPGAIVQAGCFLDGTTCTGETGPDSGAPGFVPLLTATAADDLDVFHAFSYTWCVGPVASGSHTVSLNLSSDGTVGVLLDSVHVAIDAARITQGTCSAASF